jgi:4-amino-4-deoxy-L-arabinose transferase-like glycosyltransferase
MAAVAYLYGLGNFPFVGPDEPRYAQVAREMFTRGDMITPTLAGHTWFEKPALPYWTMIAGYRLFGAGEWSARLGFALSGLLTVLVLYWIASRAEIAGADKEGLKWLALSTAVAASSSAGLLLFSHGVNFDIPLTLTTTIALGCFFVSELENDKRRRFWLLAGFYSGMGAALLAKGLIGLIITFGVVVAYYILRRSWPGRELRLSLLWGVPLALVVAAIWYAPVIARHGQAFLDEFFIQHHFARYTSNKYHHPQPFYFYIPVMMMMALPWTPYLIEALAVARRRHWRAPDALSKWRAFALAWLIMPVLFFSASGSKLPGYILPALPGAVMLIGERLARTLRGEGGLSSMRACGVLVILLALAAVIYVRHEGYPVMACAIIGALPLIVGGLIALLLTKKGLLATASIVCGIFLMIIVSLGCGIEGISRRVSIAHALAEAGRRGLSLAPVYHLHTIERTAEYYAAGRLHYGEDGEPVRFEGATQVEAVARERGGAVLVIVPTEYSWQLTTYAPLETEVIEDNGDIALVAVRIRN